MSLKLYFPFFANLSKAKNDLKDSLYQWVKKSEMISEFEYQSYKRVMKYVRYYKEELKKELSQIINVEEIEELNLNDMDSVENRLKGYRLNSFHFIQLIIKKLG